MTSHKLHDGRCIFPSTVLLATHSRLLTCSSALGAQYARFSSSGRIACGRFQVWQGWWPPRAAPGNGDGDRDTRMRLDVFGFILNVVVGFKQSDSSSVASFTDFEEDSFAADAPEHEGALTCNSGLWELRVTSSCSSVRTTSARGKRFSRASAIAGSLSQAVRANARHCAKGQRRMHLRPIYSVVPMVRAPHMAPRVIIPAAA